MASNVQTLRFRRPTNNNEADEPKKTVRKSHHTGILQDQTRRHARPPWTPSFSMAVRILLFVRFLAAIYSNISDCDEVYNYWEPLHYLDRGYGFRTWETSPVYAIRSYAYILLHWMPVRLARVIAKEKVWHPKRAAFFAVRIALAMISTLVESKFYRSVVERINLRVGRYLFFMLLFNAGMWTASTAFLPSSLALYANTLAFSYALEPPSNTNVQRTFFATLSFAAGAVLGWPFSIIMAVPFVLEELFVRGIDHVPKDGYEKWVKVRWPRLFGAGAISALLFVPVVAIDTLFYGRLTIAPWNIISYNIFSDSSQGPELYGTEPWYYYLLNLGLNFNVLLPLSLVSAPALFVTYHVDRRRLGAPGTADQSSPYTVLALRLMPVYLWTAVLTLQPHKEERFMFPAYTMICFNAACTLYLIRGWLEAAFIKVTASPYKASRSSIFRIATSSVLIYSAILSVSRICALLFYYRAPMSVVFALETTELPRVLNVTGLLSNITRPVDSYDDDDESPRIDLGPIAQFGLRVCVGKEWYRFPGSFLVPHGVDVKFIKSEFDGLIPGRFPELHKSTNGSYSVSPWGMVEGTSSIPPGMNSLNEEQLDHYVLVETCDYLVDLDFPLHPVESALEPRYAVDNTNWERVDCRPFLDARHSPLISRALWVPGQFWWNMNQYGDYCLLRSTKLEGSKIRVIKEQVEKERLASGNHDQ